MKTQNPKKKVIVAIVNPELQDINSEFWERIQNCEM